MTRLVQERAAEWIETDLSNPLFTWEEIHEAVPLTPRWPLFVQAGAAIFMLSASAYYHNFNCVAEEHYKFLIRVDLSGICVMICGCVTPPFYYTLMCEESRFWQQLWLA